jgi:hypothetical protein
MDGLRTLACLALPLLAQPVAAEDAALRLFATCTGRLSAVVEHQWLTGGAGAGSTQAARDAMEGLVQAATPAGDEARVMGWRVEAKLAQKALLARAVFGGSGREGAAERAEALLVECRGLLLG